MKLPAFRTSRCALELWPYCPRLAKGQRNTCKLTGTRIREIIVATLRMTTFLNFGEYGIAWLQSPAKMRIERLLVEYGPEFPKEITPAAYIKLFASYHAVKRAAWAVWQS